MEAAQTYAWQSPGPVADAMDLFMARATYPHPDTAPWIGAILHLSGRPPTLRALRDHLADRAAALPCLSHRLAGLEPTSRWVPCRPDPTTHIRELFVPEGEANLRAAVRLLLREPVPDHQPPWHLWLVHGFSPGRYALFYRVHHALQDMGGVASALEWLFAQDVPRRYSSAAYHRHGEARLSPDDVRAVAEQLRGGVPRARVEPWVLRSTGDERRHLWADLPTEVVRSAQVAGATGNDVYLAAFAAAVAGWLAEHMVPTGQGTTVPVLVPMNTRRPEEVALPGNRTAMARLELPGGGVSTDERLRTVAGMTVGVKSPVGRLLARHALEALPPDAALTVLTELGERGPGILASNFVLRHELRLGDDGLVERVEPIAFCFKNAPVSALLLTYRGISTINIVVDPSLPAGESLARRWRDAVHDLAASGTGRSLWATAAWVRPLS